MNNFIKSLHLSNLMFSQRGFSCLGTKEFLFKPKRLEGFRFCSTKTNSTASEKMIETLRNKFPLAKNIEVVDVSGGCGSMYEIFVESIEFKGLTMVKQHRLINETLKDDIKQMHGLRILTKIPAENS